MIRTSIVFSLLLLTPTLSDAGRLLELILSGDEKELERYLETEPQALAELNERGEDGLLPLHVAEQQENTNLTLILKRYADASVLEPHSYVRCAEMNRRNPERDPRTGNMKGTKPGSRRRATTIGTPPLHTQFGFDAPTTPLAEASRKKGVREDENKVSSAVLAREFDWSGL